MSVKESAWLASIEISTIDPSRMIASEAGSLVDIIVGGHSHSLLWNGPAPSGETVQGPYPVAVESYSNAGHKVGARLFVASSTSSFNHEMVLWSNYK